MKKCHLGVLTRLPHQRAYRLITRRRVAAVLFAIVMVCCVVVSPHRSEATDDKWKAEMIADALSAAPPSVTHNARIFAWNAAGDMILLRKSTGPDTFAFCQPNPCTPQGERR